MNDELKRPDTSDSVFPLFDYIVFYGWGFAEPFFKLIGWLFLVAALIAASDIVDNYFLTVIAITSGIVWCCASFAKCIHLADIVSDIIDDWIDSKNLGKTKSKFAHTAVNILKISLRLFVGYALISLLLSVYAFVPEMLLAIAFKP
ncbi:hypothetical protein [Sneathiella sp.]|uniref:hypothetical protein n=1 Tax=Sneathiella sp. TaxID=1964365 RepID=UPI0026081634|nr:hypothetical protein [Sneathiella sp.]MDF2366310.1 hypothetical protein [Sneathiella sp.]